MFADVPAVEVANRARAPSVLGFDAPNSSEIFIIERRAISLVVVTKLGFSSLSTLPRDTLLRSTILKSSAESAREGIPSLACE